MGTTNWILVAVMAFSLGCGDDASAPLDGGLPDATVDGAADATADAGPPPSCLAASAALMSPTPAWHDSGALAPPADDMTVGLLATRASWAGQLSAVGGWPRRPSIIVALSAEGASVDASRISLYTDGTPPTALDIPVDVRVVGTTLIILPRLPVRTGTDELLVAIADDALSGALPIPACGDDGEPHAGYAAAAARLGSPDTSFAFSFPLSNTASELPALYAELATAPVLEIDTMAAGALTDLGEFAPTPEVAALFQPQGLELIARTPAYQGTDGRFVIGTDGVPIAQGTTLPGITIALPATGTAPYPWVLYQHGGGQHRHTAFSAVGPLAEAGFAVVAIDLPAHGDRPPPGGMGGDLDILDFDDPLLSRDNLRQGSADHLAVLTSTVVLNGAIESELGVSEALDSTRSFYLGMSLGGFTGTFTATSATDLAGAALFVGGGGYQEVLDEGTFALLLADVLPRAPDRRAAVLALIALLLDGADPISYAAIEDRSKNPRCMLFFEARQDPIIANEASDRWAQAFGAGLARPFEHEVPGMEFYDLPHSGSVQFDAAGPTITRVLFQSPMADVPVSRRHAGLIQQDYAEQNVASCFSGLAAGAACEVTDTGYIDH